MKLENEELTRQFDLIPLNVLGERITIIGAGAIGSWTALALAKMGFLNLLVIDYDKVDTVNMNSQLYPRHAVGTLKTESLQDTIAEFTGHKIEILSDRYSAGKFEGIVIMAVDSMATRKLIWEQHVNNHTTRAIIDARMGAEKALLYVMNPMNNEDKEDYPKTLYSDADAEQEACTAKSTAYCATALSGLVAAQVKSLLTTKKYSRTTHWNIPLGALTAWEGKTT